MLTAIIIAIGTGTFAGLGGTSAWRVRSQDASYAALRYHDLRVRLPVNVDVPEGDLAAAIGSIPDADQVAVASERLIVATQIDASSGGRTVLVPGEIVGMDPKAAVDQLHLSSGRMGRAGEDEAVLEAKEEIIRLKSELDKEVRDRRAEVSRLERRVNQREEALDKKFDNLETREEQLNEKYADAERIEAEAKELHGRQQQELERIASLTMEEAKAILVGRIQKDAYHDAAILVRDIEAQAKEEADKKERPFFPHAFNPS